MFQDETEIHLHPTLTRMWAPVGEQPQVPAPGQNQKTTIYGGVDYATGHITYTVSKTKSGAQFLDFLQALTRRYTGKKVRLVCDNARFHQTQAVREWLAANKDKLEIYWLPPYCPTLNLIERLWGHLKCQRSPKIGHHRSLQNRPCLRECLRRLSCSVFGAGSPSGKPTEHGGTSDNYIPA